MLRAIVGVAEFKLVQHDLQHLEVQVVSGPGWLAAGAEAIQAGLQQRLGSDVHIELRLVDQIAPEASGKHRYVVSHVALPGQLGRANVFTPELSTVKA